MSRVLRRLLKKKMEGLKITTFPHTKDGREEKMNNRKEEGEGRSKRRTLKSIIASQKERTASGTKGDIVRTSGGSISQGRLSRKQANFKRLHFKAPGEGGRRYQHGVNPRRRRTESEKKKSSAAASSAIKSGRDREGGGSQEKIVRLWGLSYVGEKLG